MMGGHVELCGRGTFTGFLFGKARRVHLEDLGINERSIHAFKLLLQE